MTDKRLAKLSNYFTGPDRDEYINDDIKRRYPSGVQLSRHVGDWGLGASRTELRFGSDSLEPYGFTDIAIVRWSNVNNPIGASPGILEGIYIDGVEKRDIIALRDHLNTLLGEGNSGE